jgi:hypothetical protein
MVIKVNNKVKIDREGELEKMLPLNDADEVYVEYPVKGEALMVKKALNVCQGE